jgi:hypothetical protein
MKLTKLCKTRRKQADKTSGRKHSRADSADVVPDVTSATMQQQPLLMHCPTIATVKNTVYFKL